MKFKRSRLNHEKYLSLARRMRAGGVPLFIAEDDEPDSQKLPEGLLISQVGGFTESRVFQISPYMSGFCIYLKITSNVPGSLEISRLDLKLPWDDPSLHLLGDPTDHDPQALVYRFPGEPPLEFSMTDVLNEYIHDAVPLSRGESVEGALLALGGPMMDGLKHGETVPVSLVVWDQFHRKYLAAPSLYADRSQILRPATRKRAYRPILQCRDPK